jgi:hypothetical protein
MQTIIAARFNRTIIRMEGPAGIGNTKAIRIIPVTEWSEANVFLVHRVTRKQVLQPRVDQFYLAIPLPDQACFLELVDQSEPSLFTRDVVALVRTHVLAPDNRLEIVTRHTRRGRTWEKTTVI